MYSHITLHLNPTAVEIKSITSLPQFCTLALQGADSVLYKIKNGQLLLQVIQHYLVNIELFEYVVTKNTKIDLTITKSTFFMLVMLSGHSTLSDAAGNILTETHGNSCYLSHIEQGKYSRTFLSGYHKMLLLTINPHYIMQQSALVKALEAGVNNYFSTANTYFNLAQAPIAKRIFLLLKRLSSCEFSNPADFDKKTLRFLAESIKSYQKSLKLRVISNESQKKKAEEISDYIHQHYLDPIVNDKRALAAALCLSERTILRLAKKQFGKTLHQKVIDLKMLYSLNQLIKTDVSVKEIAEKVGYIGPYYFTKAFKRHFGITPGKAAYPIS